MNSKLQKSKLRKSRNACIVDCCSPNKFAVNIVSIWEMRMLLQKWCQLILVWNIEKQHLLSNCFVWHLVSQRKENIDIKKPENTSTIFFKSLWAYIFYFFPLFIQFRDMFLFTSYCAKIFFIVCTNDPGYFLFLLFSIHPMIFGSQPWYDIYIIFFLNIQK